MRSILRAAIVGFTGVGPAMAQMVQSDALRLVSDIRWVGGNCPALRVDYQGAQLFMDRTGLVNPFNPEGPNQSYLVEHDRRLDDGVKTVGTGAMCQSMLDRYRSTGLLVIKSKSEIDELTRLRGPYAPPIAPLE